MNQALLIGVLGAILIALLLLGASIKVVNEYERQFRSQDTRGYELEDLEATGGRAGRASGGYRVEREGRAAIAGKIVFGVVRDHGRPRIALIAVTPAG